MGQVIEDKNLRNKVFVFEDRTDAGKRLSEFLLDYKSSDSIVLAIPSGGVPVGKEIKDALSLNLDLLIVRKIQIPWNPEAGFGAVNLDGYVIFNEELLRQLYLPESVINTQAEKTKEILKKRNELFRKGRDLPSLGNKTAIIVDDGLAQIKSSIPPSIIPYNSTTFKPNISCYSLTPVFTSSFPNSFILVSFRIE
ncbi:MAG: phosphoribosyltransferase family protein [Thermodesulfovibrionales bacterium]|nr:phosphoribosyltransferase family protein [Thermodesulfovibrionales bacterium]